MLAVGSKSEKINSFEFFKPHSIKAKLVKYLAINFPIFNITYKKKSLFINYLENKLNAKFISSIYFSSCKQKVVIQLQKNEIIFAYVKYALNEKGNQKIKNEQIALESLSSEAIPKLIDKGSFNGFRFIVTKNIFSDDNYKNIKCLNLNFLLKKFKRRDASSFLLRDHPRIINIKNNLKKYYLPKYEFYFNKIISADKKKYKVIAEHGDFTPWNIINNYYLVDFEEYTKDGLDGMDICHYFFVEQLYIKKMSVKDIVDKTLASNTNNYKNIFFIYLLKTLIMRMYYNFETSDYDRAIKIFIKKLYHEA